jgi:8-oxo-dGTP pyrophosphatase MutT (NUDIX family)
MRSGKLQLIRRPQRLVPLRSDSEQQRQQVAAVCFRILSTGVEFLLVRTRRGRWTFPKGGVQNGLTHAQSAAIEAYEEAGVHGRIEEVAFLGYRMGKFMEGKTGRSKRPVQAHLCEVLRLRRPQESNRNPTWFSSEKAKRHLAQGRSAGNAAELSRVVDRALARIRRFPGRSMLASDPLLQARFEASEINARRLLEHAAKLRTHAAKSHPPLPTSAIPGRGKILQLRPLPVTRK